MELRLTTDEILCLTIHLNTNCWKDEAEDVIEVEAGFLAEADEGVALIRDLISSLGTLLLVRMQSFLPCLRVSHFLELRHSLETKRPRGLYLAQAILLLQVAGRIRSRTKRRAEQ